MRKEWEADQLIEQWTLLEEDHALLANKAGPTRLGFAVLLKFFEIEGRFPERSEDLPAVAIDYVARQLGIAASAFPNYSWSGRTIEYHRAQIRRELGFRQPTEADEARLAQWLGAEVCPVEFDRQRLVEAMVARCRAERLEPPAPGQLDRVVGSAVHRFERRFCELVASRLPAVAVERLEALVRADGGGGGVLDELKADPGRLGLTTMLAEIDKLLGLRWNHGPTGPTWGRATDKLLAHLLTPSLRIHCHGSCVSTDIRAALHNLSVLL